MDVQDALSVKLPIVHAQDALFGKPLLAFFLQKALDTVFPDPFEIRNFAHPVTRPVTEDQVP